MPVKRRTAKRGHNRAEELFAWESVFDTGWDFFGEVGRIIDGVPGGRRDWREAPETREAWNRLGEEYLTQAAHQDGSARGEWALETFGSPDNGE